MSQWVASRDGTAVAWVDVTRASADPVVFARQLVEAVSEAVPGSMRTLGDLFPEGGGYRGERFVTDVLTELAALDRDLALVFEDVERIGALDVAAEFLDALLEQLPETTRAYVIARWDPPIAFHRWRLDGRLHELRGVDLAFDVEETAALVNAVTGIDLDAPATQTLRERTDGWAAGIQLAAVSIGNCSDPGRFISQFAGTDAHVAEYLVEEVLSGLDSRMREFLVLTSVLPWLSVDLCTAVIQTFDDEEVVAALGFLDARGLFLVPVDEHEDRVRYHHPLADLLRYELRRGDRAVEQDLRRRAADWLTDAGYLNDAAEELLELADVEGLLALVREHGRRFYERNEAATLARWLVALRASTPDPTAEVEVHLLAAQFSCQQMPAAVETARSLRKRTDLTRGERAEAEALQSLLGLHNLSPTETERAATNALEIAESLEPGDCYSLIGVGAEGMVELFAWLMRGHAAFHDGDLERAQKMFAQALATREADYVGWRVNILGATALVHAWTGHLSESEALSQSAVALAHESLTPRYVGLADSQLAAALTALNRLDLAGARRHLEQVRPTVERSRRPPLIGMFGLLRAGLTALERGAVAALAEIERTVPTGVQPKLTDLASRSLHARLLIAVGRASAARAVIGSIPAGPDAPSARVDLALALDDCTTAKAELAAWSVSPSDLDSLVGRQVRRAAVTWRDGSRGSALRSLREALSLAATDRLTRPFLEVRAALALLRSEPQLHTGLAAEILTAADRVYVQQDRRAGLVDPLTDRELEILALLPSRLSNNDLASALFISVNTLKTHLRHIYVKLDAEDRDDAIDRAAAACLL